MSAVDSLCILQVSLPSEDKRNPNVFEFGTSYKDILTKLEERGLDKYHRDPCIIGLLLNLTLTLGASTLGVRTSGKCWNATRSSNGPHNVGKTARSSESMPYFLTLELPSISPLISPLLSQSVISRHDVVITFDDEVYDMVQLGKLHASQ